MGDNSVECVEVFVQDGVLLKEVPASYITHLNSHGTLYVSETRDSEKKRYIEWKPNDITVDSDIQDQEWAVVNTIQKRTRTLSGNLPADYKNRIVCIKISFEDIKSFRVANKYRQLSFFDGKTECLYSFLFQHGNCEVLVATLRTMMRTTVSKRDKQRFIVLDSTVEMQQLDSSFAELNLPGHNNSFWGMMRNIKENPYEATIEVFAKVTDYVYRSPEQREMDRTMVEELTRSINEYENTTTSHSKGDYEVISKVPELPPMKSFPRCQPLSPRQWKNHQDCLGMIEDVESVKNMIFRGGVTPEIRSEVWKFLLDYYPWNSVELERTKLVKEKNQEYYVMKLQWKSLTPTQENNFSNYREHKNLIEKDVNRTDRTLDFYAGDNNYNLHLLSDILMTYVMYNFDLGYVQGMSDLLSPILQLIGDEVDSFWCFVGFMNKVICNFDIDQAGMKEQLSNLYRLVAFVDPELATYLNNHDSGNMFFCFRWLLVWFKREFSQDDIMRLWEVLWTGLPCDNFHLLISVAILVSEKENLIKNDYGFTEILKTVNELSGKLDVDMILSKAEGIFYQIKEAEHLNDSIRLLVGLPLLTNSSFGSGGKEQSSFEIEQDPNEPCCSVENVRISPDDIAFEHAIESNYL